MLLKACGLNAMQIMRVFTSTTEITTEKMNNMQCAAGCTISTKNGVKWRGKKADPEGSSFWGAINARIFSKINFIDLRKTNKFHLNRNSQCLILSDREMKMAVHATHPLIYARSVDSFRRVLFISQWDVTTTTTMNWAQYQQNNGLMVC